MGDIKKNFPELLTVSAGHFLVAGKETAENKIQNRFLWRPTGSAPQIPDENQRALLVLGFFLSKNDITRTNDFINRALPAFSQKEFLSFDHKLNAVILALKTPGDKGNTLANQIIKHYQKQQETIENASKIMKKYQIELATMKTFKDGPEPVHIAPP